MCTPFSRLPQAQLLRLDSFFFGALCVMSGGRLPAALFMVFLLDSGGAVPSRPFRAECLVHLLFFNSPRPRCIAAVCRFLLRGCVFRPDDACQKRFSWFSDWIPKVQKCFVRRTLARSAFHGFSIGFQRCARVCTSCRYEILENC